jgi:hypothetical protein
MQMASGAMQYRLLSTEFQNAHLNHMFLKFPNTCQSHVLAVARLLSICRVPKAMLKCVNISWSARQMSMQKTRGTAFPPLDAHNFKAHSMAHFFANVFEFAVLAVVNGLLCIGGLKKAMLIFVDFSLSAVQM